MVSVIALTICALIPTATLATVDTCDASDPSKCMSAAGTEKLATQGNALLQGVHTKGRAQNVHEEVMEDQIAENGPKSQVEENFNEMEKHAKSLTDRLDLALENSREEPEHHGLTPEVEEKVHHALAMLQQVHQDIKDVRKEHASFMQSPATAADESRGKIMESIRNIWKLAQDAEEVLAEADGVDDYHDEEEALVQEGEEVEEEEDEEEDEEEGEEGEEDEEEDEEHEEHDEEEDEHEHEDDEEAHEEHEEHEDVSEMQKGEGVQYEPEEEEKSIERH